MAIHVPSVPVAPISPWICGKAELVIEMSSDAINAPSALATMTNAISKQDGAITNLKIINRQQDFFEVLVDVEVRDTKHLNNVIAGLRGASGITQVERAKG